MSGESSKRSNLIDVTYQQLHSVLSGHLEGTSPSQLLQLLKPRVKNLHDVASPFGSPSDALRKMIDGGTVTLPDGVVLHVETLDKDFVYAISDKFQIDQVQAFILLRSFLYNEGLPPHTGSNVVEELVEAITPFYFSERLFILRVLIPLFRAKENPIDPIHEIATDILPEMLPDGRAFAESVVTEYLRKRQENVPKNVNGDPRAASRWAKQNYREQLVTLEVLFWTMWGYVSCDGPIVARIFEAAYQTSFGSTQHDNNMLLDEEAHQLQQDSAALWLLITIEVLELERISEPGGVEISDDPADKGFYLSSPEFLEKIHALVISHRDSRYACTYLAWAFVLSRVVESAKGLKEIPDVYREFFDAILPNQRHSSSYSKDREPAHVIMTRTVLDPQAGLFSLMMMLLTSTPLFVTAIAWKTGSTVTDPNAIAFRSVLKGLVISLLELVPIENIPDTDALISVWVSLFGRSESQSITGICRQFWLSDFHTGIARRAILDFARARFPVVFKSLICLLRSLTAAGFLDTDPLSTEDHSHEGEGLDEERATCARSVFEYLGNLPTFSQIVGSSSRTGTNALYEKVHGTAVGSPEYANLRPIKLPGGSSLQVKSTGRILTRDGSDVVAVCWEHEHSGWKLILEVLTDFVNVRRRQTSGSHDVSFSPRGAVQITTLTLEDVGVQMDAEGDEGLVTDALDLVRSVIQDNPILAEELLESLEAGDPVVSHTMTEVQPPDLVQLTTMILEEALSRSDGQGRSSPRTQLITSAISVLSGLLALPKYSSRVWLYIRSTTALFGSEKNVGVVSSALGAERVTGHYTMTLALLYLVQQLFQEASSSVLTLLPGNKRLHQVKEEVLLRATRFIHAEIWVEHPGWKYAQLGDRFAIGKRVASFFADVLKYAMPTPGPDDGLFAALTQAVVDILLYKATTLAINPLVYSVATGGSTLRMLFASRRFGDARRLIYLLESHLRLIRLVLNYKQRSQWSGKPCLLEQVLCSRAPSGTVSLDSRNRVDPVDVLASYVKDRDLGSTVPLEAMRVLYALCSSLSSSQPSPPTIVGHLSDPEATASFLVRIVQHPYDELVLRNSVWNFISLAVDKEPALGSLFVTGQFSLPINFKGKSKDNDELAPEAVSKSKRVSAIDVAKEALAGWKELWELNPQLLASVLRFLDVVWQHGLEHTSVLQSTRQDAGFWTYLAGITQMELGPVSDYKTTACVLLDGVQRADQHEAVSIHAYRTIIKSYALHIIGLDMGIHLHSHVRGQPSSKPVSYTKVEGQLKAQTQLTKLISESSTSSYDPALYDELVECTKTDFPALTLGQLESQIPLVEREFGDDFMFSITLLQVRLQPFQTGDGMSDHTRDVEMHIRSINLNLSLAHSQTALAESWQFFLRQIVPYVHGDPIVRPTMLSIAASISFDIANETRSGDMMSTIHGTRLSLLLSLLEVAWFSTSDKPEEVKYFISLLDSIPGIILNEAQPPAKSIMGTISIPFHRTLLQIIYFCSRHCRNLSARPKILNADQRLRINAMLEASLTLVTDALRVVFDSARNRVDVELDRDMEILVSVFEQCTRLDINPSSTMWLTRCQETDVIKTSLNLFVHTDLVGLTDIPLLLMRKGPPYSPYILMFHMALASIPAAAEKLASEGVLVAYSNTGISQVISAGEIDVQLPELPGERSPAHRAYCSMLAIVAAVIAALGRHNHYFDAEASGFVQLYGNQISRALSWTIGDAVTMPLLEEIELVVSLFSSIADSTSAAANTSTVITKVLRVFSTHALLLLQQVNYALSHPNHLASLLEPVTAEERAQMLKDPREENQLKRPIVNQLVLRFFRLSSMLVSTLNSISGADSVLIGEQEDWPAHEALIVPHSKVVLGEPASLGTLLELGNRTLDHVKELVGKPSSQVSSESERQAAISTARRNLEAILVYAVTQLAMWLSKPEFESSAVDTDMDEQHFRDRESGQRDDASKERRARVASVTLAERLRRGMTGEMAADLQSLLNKAKPTLQAGSDVDLTGVLANFLRDRVIVPP